MPQNTKPDSDPSTGFDPALQTEKISFNPDELVECVGCGRMNPPNRLKCLYCARILGTKLKAADSGKVTFRKLELWEKGFNLITAGRSADADLQKIARLLSVEQDQLGETLAPSIPLPIARVETEKEASFLKTSLGSLGLESSIVRDVDLAADTPTRRIRAMGFGESELVFMDFNTGSTMNVPYSELVVIVVGTLIAGRIDSTEKRGRGGKRKLLDETATASDQPVLDIYRLGDPSGFRVYYAGFDFSCLGKDKGLLAGENMRLLTSKLKQHAQTVRVVNDYSSVHHLLDKTWELESRSDPQGIQRAGIGKMGYGSVATTNNTNQFMKYSRLQWHLYGKE